MTLSSTSRTLRDLTNNKMNEIDKTIDEVAKAMLDIADTTARSDLEARLLMVRLKREKVKAMTAIARSEKVLADMEVLIAESELGLELNSMKRKKSYHESCQPAAKKSKTSEEKSSGKSQLRPDVIAAKLIAAVSTNRKPESKSVAAKQKEAPKSKETTKLQEATPSQTSTPLPQSSKTSRSKDKKKSSKPARKTTDSATNKSLPKSFGKQTILLANPPIKDAPIMANNVGYYTTEYANEILGYVPKDLSVCNKALCICNPNDNACNKNQSEAQTHRRNMVRGYNLNVTPGYNLSVCPGYLLTDPRMDTGSVGNQKIYTYQQPTGFNQRPKLFNLSTAVNQHPTVYSGESTNDIDAKLGSDGQQPALSQLVIENPHSVSDQQEISGNQNEPEILISSSQTNAVTNKLFNEIRNTKNIKEEKDNDLCSLSSIETLVIHTL